MVCENFSCVFVVLFLVGVGAIAFVSFVFWMIRRKSDDELNFGGQPLTSTESQGDQTDEEDENEDLITDKSERIRVKKGDKIPFKDWVFEVTGINDNNWNIFGNLIITLPPGAKFLSMTRQFSESYPVGTLGFTIIYKPVGPAVAKTMTYDSDPSDSLEFESYKMFVEEIIIFEKDLLS